MEKRETVSLADFDWNSLTSDDVVGFDYQSAYFYILKGFKINTDDYKYIQIPVPRRMAEAIGDYAAPSLHDSFLDN
jgi:hypothetical protein